MGRNYEKRIIVEKLKRIERIVERCYYDDKISYSDYSEVQHEIDSIVSDIQAEMLVNDINYMFSLFGKLLK